MKEERHGIDELAKKLFGGKDDTFEDPKSHLI